MGNKQLSAEEKERLVIAFLNSSDTQVDFAAKHEICAKSLMRWVAAYKKDGSAGLIRANGKNSKDLVTNLTTDNELRKEILRLRIENERLKKNYTVRQNEDGTKEYIRLRPKSSK